MQMQIASASANLVKSNINTKCKIWNANVNANANLVSKCIKYKFGKFIKYKILLNSSNFKFDKKIFNFFMKFN
jgi:hypothetical protein